MPPGPPHRGGGGRPGGRPPPWARPRPNAQPRRRLLDVRREAHFRYDVRQALAEGKVPPAEGSAIYATTFSKGSRISVEEAKDYLHAKTEEGKLPAPVRDRILQLIDYYGCWR